MNDVDLELRALDKLAGQLQQNYDRWGFTFREARELVQHLDAKADEREVQAYGEDSLERRQIEVLKNAKVLQRDSDETHLSTFEAGRVLQHDADEPYMSAYGGDQSSSVGRGSDMNGRKLAPTY